MKEEKSKKNYQFVIIIMLFRKIDTFHLHLSTSFLGVLFKLCKNIINMVLKCIAFPFYLFYIFNTLLHISSQPPRSIPSTVDVHSQRLNKECVQCKHRVGVVKIRVYVYVWSVVRAAAEAVRLGLQNFLLSPLQVPRAKFNSTSVRGGADLKNPIDIPFL